MAELKMPLSLLQNDIFASWIDVPKCFKCHSFFHKKKNVPHYPCRLSCGHILCSSCLLSMKKSKNKNDAKCGQCSQKIQNEYSSEWIALEYDYSLMGFLNYQTSIVPYMLQNVPTDSKTISPATREYICVECSMKTKYICPDCKSNPYCKRCFSKVHSAGVVFKEHQIKHLDSISTTIGEPLGLCKTHHKEMIHYCQTCSLPICRTCVTSSHSKHDTKDLVKINEKVDLDEPLKLLKNVREVIEERKKTTVECIDKLDQFATSTAQNIFATFQRYHSILQNLEADAYTDLKKQTVATLQELHSVQNYIDVSGNKIAGIISYLKHSKKVTPTDVNLSTIMNEIMCLLETLEIDFDFEQFSNNLFNFDANSFKVNCDLKDLCKIKFENSPFKAKMQTFYTAKKLGINVDAPSSSSDISSCDSSIYDLSACVVESRKRAPSTKARSVQQSNQHPPIKTREVTISEISDPKTFYVQDFQFIAQSNPLIRKCNQCAMEKKMPTAVVIDEMYLVYENNRDEWHRGIVTEKKKLITLYLVDYGRHVQVMLKQIREISDELKQIPKSSSVFTIRNVEPTEGKWSEESNELILQMALGNNATIIYTEENSGDCIIHLDFPTSIEETLLYLNYAQARKIYDEAEHQITNEMMREKKLLMERLNNTKPFVKHVIKDESYCKVTNIVSPAQLYITSEDHIDEIEVLHGKLQQFYAKPYAQKLYYPHLQMVCCVCIDDTTWYRARIEAHHPGCVVEVYLVDIGKYMNIGWRFLRRLDDQFSKLPEGVTECSLVDIAPKNHAKDWGLNVTTELKRLCKDKLKVNIIGFNSRTTKIQLYIVKKKINYQINAYLAKHHLVEWVGDGDCIVERVNDTDTELLNESAVSAAISKEASQRKFRQTIKIVDIVSPSEFYVTLVKYESAIKKMHTEIQNTMKSYVPVTNNSLQWKVGDCCLVTKCLKESNDWYRGKIESNMDNQNFIVFLRDHGEMVFAKLSDLAPISPSLGLVIDGTMKCHLANIKPTSTDWAKAAIDEFKYITREECDIFAISVYGEVNNASTPVYLWGRKKQVRDDAIGAPINWININEAFASLGYADSPARFKTIVDCNPMIEFLHKEQIDFNAWHEKLLNLGNEDKVSSDAKQDHILRDGDDFILEAELDPDNAGFLKEIVTTWLPAQPISKYYFNACPTYVDNNAVIYLHEQSRSNYLKQIMYTINRTIGKDKYDESYKWKENEPCMVKYHLDDCFYRGLIKEVLSNGRYKVVFVDYGNIELCEAKELRVANVLGNVPIQATKYYLAYVKSISDDGIWGQKILEFIHVTIVNKSVSIRVEDNIDYEYVPCTITIGAMDLIKTLVAEKLAEYTPELPLKRNLPETHDFYHENSRLAVPDVRDVDSYKESIVALDLFKEKRAKRTEAAKVKEFISKIDIDQSADFIVEESDVELQPNNTFQSDSIEYEADFKPLDTSTTISTAMKTFSLLPFKPIQLTKEVIKFPCKIYEVLDTLHLFVEPIIQEYNDNFDKMEKKIKTYCNKKRNHSDITASRYCLAPYKEDNFYYRAVVNERISKTQARIRFVDYLNEEVVDCKSLRECPAELLEKPLKHMIVKLHGITPSRRIRDSDIKRQLHSLTGQTAIAFVVVNGDIPAVRLYDQNHSDVLLYKSLIDLKFFIETR